ncbi:MAG: RNA 3'-terminal phosphate cyclase [Candidatus Woesearchaeota archaeon]
MMIILNGENGGGQMLRTALALSTITKKPFRMINIRKKRPQPGLKKQHLACIKAFEHLFKCKVINKNIGSEEIEFYPGELKAKRLNIDIETAGSITLFLQSLLLPCFVNGNSIIIKVIGGTDVKFSMPFDYFNEIILPHYKRFSEYKMILNKRGFYPKGNGSVELKILKHNKNFIKKVDLTQKGNLEIIKGISIASKELEHKNVAQRQAYAASNYFLKLKKPIKIETMYYETKDIGSSITLWALFSKNDDIDYFNPMKTGADYLGEKHISSEKIGENAAKKLYENIVNEFYCDEHLADNLIPIMSLIGGKIKTNKITEHILNNINVCEKFTKTKFEIKNNIIYTLN